MLRPVWDCTKSLFHKALPVNHLALLLNGVLTTFNSMIGKSKPKKVPIKDKIDPFQH